MSAHTPGPWSLTLGTLFNGKTYARAVVDRDGRSVRVSAMTLSGGDECDANARLIAAAPELLEALRAFCSQDASHGMTEGERRDKALAAIKKATEA
jgi:hypothetical protein